MIHHAFTCFWCRRCPGRVDEHGPSAVTSGYSGNSFHQASQTYCRLEFESMLSGTYECEYELVCSSNEKCIAVRDRLYSIACANFPSIDLPNFLT